MLILLNSWTEAKVCREQGSEMLPFRGIILICFDDGFMFRVMIQAHFSMLKEMVFDLHV